MQFCMSLTWQWVNPGTQDFCIANRSFFHMDINCKGVLGEGRVFSHHLGIPHLPWVSHKTNAKPTNIFKFDLVVFKFSSLISKIHIYIYIRVYTQPACQFKSFLMSEVSREGPGLHNYDVWWFYGMLHFYGCNVVQIYVFMCVLFFMHQCVKSCEMYYLVCH